MILIEVNGVGVSLPEGATLLDASPSVPALCHDSRLSPLGTCRLCLTEVEGHDRPVPACMTAAVSGMKVRTHTGALEAGRREELRLLARGLPGDLPDSDLRRWLDRYGIAPGAHNPSDPALVDNSHPYLAVDMNLCIGCYRCVRICDDVQGQFVWRAHGRGETLRIVAGEGVPLGQSECVSCGACADTCPTGAIADRYTSASIERWTRTTCPYCGTGCEMEVGVEAGRIVQVKPVPDAPVNKGHLCVKGRYAHGFVHATDRVTEPMIRAEGLWRRATWDEAIAFTAKRLGEILRKQGPRATGMLGSARATNEENYVAQKFARVVLGTNNVDCCARVCHAPTATAMNEMLGTGAATNSFDDIERAACILVWGANATENHPIVGARIRQAAIRGVPLIVADPRATELARIARLHLALRPGTDVALLNGLAHVIVKERLHDASFVGARVSGWDAFAAFIEGWTPERASQISGVPAARIEAAARLYARTQPAMSIHGLGLTEHTQGTEGVMALVNLALLTGSIGKPGSGVNPLRGQNNVQGSAHMGCEPAHLTGYAPLAAHAVRFEAAWGASIPRERGLTMLEMMDAAARGELRALWSIGYDILFTNANVAATREALGRIDFVVVQDLFLNETAKEFGTVFLPAASSFEKDGTFMNAERRVQRVRRAIPPVGHSLSDWEIVCRVARAMGHGDGFSFNSAEEIWNEIRTVWPKGAGISYSRLDREAGIQWPCMSEGEPGQTILHTDSFGHGERARLRGIEYEPAPEAASAEYPFLLMTGRTLYQFNAGTMSMRTPNEKLRPADTLDIAPADAAKLGLRRGDKVGVVSRHGQVNLAVHVDSRVEAGQLFATFHSTAAWVNDLTGPARDNYTGTPEYKVTAVKILRQEPQTGSA